MSIRTASARRFVMTDRRPGPVACRHEETLTNGWSTTDLVMEGAARASLATCDSGFTLADLVDAVRDLMLEHGINFVGETSRPDKYPDEASRVVWGRFGDMHRAGIFRVTGGAA